MCHNESIVLINAVASILFDAVSVQLLLSGSFGIVSGITFLLIGCCWPMTYCWNKRRPVNERSFTALGCYSCFLVVMMVLCTGVMSVLLVTELPFSLDFQYHYVQTVTLILIVASLASVLGIFLFCSFVCCCYNRREIGRIY